MPSSEVIQGHAGQDAVPALKSRMPPPSLLHGHAVRSCTNGVNLRNSRLNNSTKAAHPSRQDAAPNGATTASPIGTSASSAEAGASLHPMCQPTPVQALVQLMDNLATHRPPVQDSRAILTALNDYIGDAISQTGAAAATDSCHFSATGDVPPAAPVPAVFTAGAAQKPPLSPVNGVTNGAHPQGQFAVPAMKSAAAAGEREAQVEPPRARTFTAGQSPADVKRPTVLGATATATASSADSTASSGTVTGSAATPSATLHEHILRWSADLGILQALHANGYSEADVENFVHKLLPGLADGVTSQLSQAGFPVAALNAVVAQSAQAATVAAAAAAVPLSKASGLAQQLPTVKNGIPPKATIAPPVAPVAAASAAAESVSAAIAALDRAKPLAADLSAESASPGSVASQPPALAPPSQPGAVLTAKVSPFIQHPYQLLQQLHDQALNRSGSDSGSATAPAAGAPVQSERTFPKFTAEGPPANGLHRKTASGGPQEPNTPSLSAQSAQQGQQSRNSPTADTSLTAASQKDAPDASDSADSSSTRSTSEVLPAAQPATLASARSVASSGTSASPGSLPEASGMSSAAVPSGWKSVLEKLIQAGPQTVQPAAPYVPGSYGWGSGNSSTEHDTFSAKSEDAQQQEGGAVGTRSGGSATPACGNGINGNGTKAKKRRNKRGKSGRS